MSPQPFHIGAEILEPGQRRTIDLPVSVLSNHAEHASRLSADDDRRVRALNGFGVAERFAELEVSAVEVEWFFFRPQAPDDRACLREAPHGVAGR